jgi:capsular polysaccharide biosynthesis protein
VLIRLVRRLRSGRHSDKASEIAALVASYLGDADAPLVAVRRKSPPGTAEAVRAALPAAEVVELPADASERRLSMAICGPFDAIIENDDQKGSRAHLFQETFWRLAPGRPYIVPGGAPEVGPAPGSLGTLLRKARSTPDKPLRTRRKGRHHHVPLALKNHVRTSVVGDHLVLSHDLPDVLVKIREEDCNAFLASTGGRHRVLEVIEAEDPPRAPIFREGPEARRARMDDPISRSALSLRDYRDVVVAAPQVVTDGRVLLPDTFRHNQSRLLGHKALADLAPGFAVLVTPIGADLPRLEGTFVHLDNEARGHFGHMLTETLSRIWTWEKAIEIDPDARAIMGATRRRPEITESEYAFYAACGIPRDRITLVDDGRPVIVERLISGTPMWSQPHYVHPRICETWRRVGDTLAATVPADTDWPRRIFVSRRSVKRACVNGGQLEAEFEQAGFVVVFPEDFPLGHQVALFRHAEVIAGYGGSGMFQTLFTSEPKHVIQVASEAYSPRNEYLIAAALGHRLDSVVCRAEPYDGPRVMHAPFRYDLEREGPYLREILASLPAIER